MLAVGLMSGTSLDGVDAVLCEIDGVDRTTRVTQKHFIVYPMPEDLREKIQLCCTNQAHTDLICSLNVELGNLFADAALTLCQEAGINFCDLDFIASHGQTIYHLPQPEAPFVPSTLQIGEAAVIAERCGTVVVSNFRPKDIAAGGQGAPLVPFTEYVLYVDPHKQRALQNIGGISNITVLPADTEIDGIYAFDCGPGNMVIDEAMRMLFDKPYDEAGQTALSGCLITELQEELKQHPYIETAPPKTTGREDFGSEFTHDILARYSAYAKEDVVATLTWFTAYCIARNIELFAPKTGLDELILAGGGAHNLALRTYLAELLPNCRVLTQEDMGLSSDAKEAIAFVILGNQTLHRRPGNVMGATGARKQVVLGQVTYPN